MHEMSQPLTGYTSGYGAWPKEGLGVIDRPESPYSPQRLYDNRVHGMG